MNLCGGQALKYSVPTDGIDTAVTLFCASSLLCLFAPLFVLLAKRRLRNCLLHEGGSLTKHCADRKRKFDGFGGW